MEDNHENFWRETANVPCNGCQKCCKGEQVVIYPEEGETPEKYKVAPCITPKGEPGMALQQKQNGDCIYLGENGCEIYNDRPTVCRSYDCRVAYLSFTRAMRAMEAGRGNDGNFQEGKERLHTLDSRRRRIAIAVRKMRETMRIISI